MPKWTWKQSKNHNWYHVTPRGDRITVFAVFDAFGLDAGWRFIINDEYSQERFTCFEDAMVAAQEDYDQYYL